MRNLSARLTSWPLGFFGLLREDARRLIALKARVLVERGVGRRGNLSFIGRLLVVLFPGHGRPQRDDFGGVFVDQQDVLVRMGFLLAAVLLLVLRGLGGTLATALRTVDGHIRGALQRQGTGGNPAGIALRRHAESGQGTLEDREQAMNPVVGLGLAELNLQPMHGLQGIGFLVDEDKEQFVCHLRQAAFGATAALAVAYLAFPGLVWRREGSIGRSKGWQHTGELFVRQAGRSQALSRSVL